MPHSKPGPALFDNRDFTLLWGGELLSEVGSQTATVAYPLLILALTGSASKAGVVGLTKWLPLALFVLPAGALADRFDRKRLMIVCDLTRLLGAASVVTVLLIGRPPYAQILLVAFLDGAMFTISHICERGALRQVVPQDQVEDAVARNEARTFAAGIVGPSLGGVLFSATRALPFIADVASYLCSVAAITATRSRFQPESAASEKPRFGEVVAGAIVGFGWLRSRPFYLTMGLLFGVGNAVYTGLYLLAVLLAKHQHASSAMVGAMLSVVAVCGLLGAVLAAPLRRWISTRALLIGETWTMLGVVLALAVVRVPLLIGLLIGVAEFAAPAANAAVAGSRVAITPDQLQGRVQSAATVLAASLAWLGPLAVGYLFERTGPTDTVLAVAGWTGVLAIATTLAPPVRRHRDGDGPTRPTATAPASGRSAPRSESA